MKKNDIKKVIEKFANQSNPFRILLDKMNESNEFADNYLGYLESKNFGNEIDLTMFLLQNNGQMKTLWGILFICIVMLDYYLCSVSFLFSVMFSIFLGLLLILWLIFGQEKSNLE